MKNENDQKIQNYKKQQMKKWLIIFLCFDVVVLEILALLNLIDMLWGCVLFAIVFLLKKII